MSLFNSADFSKMEYNPNILSKKAKIRNHYPKLNSIEGVKKYKGDERDIHYMMYMYDKKSPFVSHYSNLEDRKNNSALQAGFNPSKDANHLEELFTLSDKDFTAMLLDFLKSLNWMKWTLLISNEETFYEYQKAILEEIKNFKTDKDKLNAVQVKSHLMTDCDTIVERIARYKEEIFSEEEVIRKSDIRKSTPEYVAKSITNV